MSDILTKEKEEKIPLMIFEVLSHNKKEDDLYFKPYFYETIGVQEYYICQSSRTQGAIIKAYRLKYYLKNNYHLKD